MFRNNIIGDSPDGLVFTDPHGACAVGILEVKCAYSMRDVHEEWPAVWRLYLKVSRAQQHAQEDPLLISSNQRGDGGGSGGLVRLCHLDPELDEDSTHSSR